MTEGISLRFAFFIDGELAEAVWVHTPEQADEVGARHSRRADEADSRGQRWLMEVFDPDAPPATAYFRFGTDEGGMVEPSSREAWEEFDVKAAGWIRGNTFRRRYESAPAENCQHPGGEC